MNKLRTICLSTIAIATAFTLAKSVINPAARSVTISNYTFPETINLSQWQLSFSTPVSPNLVKRPANILGKFVAGKRYRYRQQQEYLDLEMRYLSDTNGDLKDFISDRVGELSSTLKENDSGFYALYTYGDRAYLDACINPSGVSTVTSDQFQRNLMLANNHAERVLPWLFGRAKLNDDRCLWAHISMPLQTSPERAYQTLETAWSEWHQQWRSHYPEFQTMTYNKDYEG